jgi:nitrate/nitrite transport system substrate-binding protein
MTAVPVTRRRAIATPAALLAAARAAAPLIVAKEKGFFAKYGMPEVEVAKQASWGATRDNLVLGSERGGIDGAHILTPMPYLIHTGRVTQNNQPVAMAIVARLNTNGEGISVAEKHRALGVRLDAAPFKRVLTPESKMAVTFRGGTHDLWLRYWLAAAGIDPDRDVQTIVVPPPQMVANMRVGTMEAFCVGEPWNAQLINQGLGYSALVTGQPWRDHPEKSLALRADFVQRYPRATEPLVAATIEAARWCDTRIMRNSRRSWAAGLGSTCHPPTSRGASRASSTSATGAS